MSLSSARTSAPPRTTSSPPTTSRSTRCGPERTSPATRSSAPPSSSPSVAPDREVGLLARLERPDVVAAEHLRAAARREPERLARGHRLAAAAAARDEERLLDLHEQVAPLVRRGAVDAEPDAHAGVDAARGRARRRRRGGGSTSGSARRRSRSRPNRATSSSERCTQCAHHTSRSSQPSRSRYSTGRAAVELAAVRLLLDGLGEVRVEHEPEPPRERGRLLHQPARDRERRARRDRDLHARARPRSRAARRGAAPSRRGPRRSPRRARRAAGRRPRRRGPSSRATRRSARRARAPPAPPPRGSPSRPRGKT